jgi:arylsulfatase A-like enzyme
MRKPNIILLIAEELGQGFLGYSGNKDSETPSLDSLSEKGVVFNNHFTVHGKCVPSRAALYSGRYCHNGGHRTLGIELRKNEISLANILKKNGYNTIMAGKNHTVDESCVNEQFLERWTSGLNGKKYADYAKYTKETTSNDRSPGNKHADNYIFGKINIKENDTEDYLLTERLCHFIKKRESDQPYFINLNYHYTHPPYEIMEPYYSKFMKKDLALLPDNPGKNKPEFMYKMHELYGFSRLSENDRKEMLACYYGMLNFLDNRVKEIYEALEEAGELNNTILIFTSDHGDLAGHHGLPEKWDTIFSDCIMKIPLLIHCPEKFAPMKIEALTENIDVLPTLLELLDIEAPYGIQGKSLSRVAQGAKKEHKDYVFAEGGHEKELLDVEIKPDKHRLLIVGYLKKAEMREIMPDSLRKAKMIRTKKYKLVYRIKDKNEFYDLENDPREQVNCYDKPEFAEEIRKMEKTLLDHLIETEENLPFDPVPIS